MKRRWCGFFLFFLMLGWVVAAGAQTPLFSDDFNRTGSNLGPNWAAIVGSFSTDGTQAVSQSAQNWAKVTAAIGTDDYQVEARITPPAGSNYTGLVARGDAAFFYKDLYAVQIDAVSQKVNLYRRNAGTWTLLRGGAAPGGIVAGTSYLLAMKVFGSNPVQLEILFQGALLFSYSDSAANRILSGAPGIQNYNSGVRYDHFVVSSLTPPAGNQPPVASFSASPTSGSVPLAVSFNASASSDPDGSIATFSWNFGDGTTGSGVTTGHTYQNSGTFTATLTVTDNSGAQNSTTRTISVQSTGGGGGETILFEDNFNRTGSTLGTNWRLDGGSFSTDGTMAVSGGSANWAGLTTSIGTSDYAVESILIVPAGSFYSGIAARGKSTAVNSDNYNLQISTQGTVNLYRRNAGAWTLLRSIAAPGGIVAGTPYKLKLKVSGANPTNLEVSFQDALLFTYADSSTGQLFSGQPGISNYNAGVKYDHFRVMGFGSGGGNQSPVARFTCTPSSGNGPLTTTCDASASSDPDGSIATFSWNFGDGTTGSGVTTGHTYQNSGSYTVTLVVTDTMGGRGTASGTITVNPAAGTGWTASRVPGDLKGVHFVDRNIGWATGMDLGIFKTTDGGKSWTKQTNIVWKSTPPQILPDVYDVFFINSQVGWAAGWPELILGTTDGGATWREQHLNRAYTTPTNYCEAFDAAGTCLKKKGPYMRRVRFADASNGWVVGRYGYIFRTTNGGTTWTFIRQNWPLPVPCPPRTAYTPHWFGLDVVSTNEIWISGGMDDGSGCPGWNRVIVHSNDGGATWIYQNELPEFGGLGGSGRYHDLHLIGNLGWAVGEIGAVLRTTDHGATWRQVTNTGAGNISLWGLAFPDPQHIWIVGTGGLILHSADGGTTWVKQNSNTANRLHRVSFVDAFFGWAAGHLGVITRTTSGGG
ncbi:MAG: PKD domain-containing protein [Candidatus Manganitrophus sp. SA1]|nr:PKD domain-containing protein [Candidatus Manganitrophus morganii]